MKNENSLGMNISQKHGLRHNMLLFGALFLISILLNIGLFRDLVFISFEHDFTSHILLIPFISMYLIVKERSAIFIEKSGYCYYGIPVLLAGAAIAGPWAAFDISFKTLGIMLLWIGMFLFIFGMESFRKASFPLLFLIFMVPIPETILHHIVVALQKGSAEASAILFKMTGTLYFRDGFYFKLDGGVEIEIAEQCSSIRSSLALLISSLLASHLLLRSNWRRAVLVAVSLPVAMIKNAVRIVVLSLLAIHVDKGWLTDSNLHHDGGIIFFILALLLLFPLLLFLRKSEEKARDKESEIK